MHLIILMKMHNIKLNIKYNNNNNNIIMIVIVIIIFYIIIIIIIIIKILNYDNHHSNPKVLFVLL